MTALISCSRNVSIVTCHFILQLGRNKVKPGAANDPGKLAAARCHGLRQSLVAVSSALVACGAQWRRAAQLCQGLRKDVVCYGALLSCNERAQRWEGALQVLRRRFRLPTAFERR